MAATSARTFGLSAMLFVFAALAAPSLAQDQPSGRETNARIKADSMAIDIVGKMTIDEKLAQLLNTAPAIPRLNIPGYNWWTESLHGAMGTISTTNFPEPIGLAATFDAPMIQDVANAISTEVRGLHTLARQTGRLGRIGTGLNTWSPNINIFRDPRWGRGQETYGEDPYLTATMGVAFVRGMQGENPDLPNVIATPKHFAVHNGPESTRHSANVFVSRHDLEDTYLPAFRAAIVEGKAGSIMCAYNRVDGQPACASDMLLREYLRGAWKFKGYVVSDCDAVKDISDNHHYSPDRATAVAAALRAGVDSECHTWTLGDNGGGLADRYREALDRGLLTEGDIDRALVRLFSARIRNGDLPGLRDPQARIPTTAVGAAEHGALALKAAEDSLVLLKNDGVLPLQPGVRVAVIGPLADATRVLRGNYSSGLSGTPVSVLEGLRSVMPTAQIGYAPFSESLTDGDRVPGNALRAPDGKPGLLARYYNSVSPTGASPTSTPAKTQYQTAPAVTRREADVAARSLDLAQVSDHHRVVFTGDIVPFESGTYRLGLTGINGAMKLNGKAFVDLTKAGWGSLPTMKTIRLEKGKRYAVEISGEVSGGGALDLVWKRVSATADADMAAAAKDADVIVAVVGLTSDLEAEESPVEVPGFKGGDKTTLDLPEDQKAMLRRARALGKPLIVVAMNGSPINLSWEKDNAAAIIEAWYPGQSGGLAIANILTGQANPSGRLPLTFYKSVDELPPFGDYDMTGRTYRYFTGAPVYSFGFGLSYTSFEYDALEVKPIRVDGGNGIRVTARVRNSGDRAGDEVAQLYLNFPQLPGVPRIALRGYQRVALKPGEAQSVRFDLSPRDLSSVTPDGDRRVAVGDYRVSVGSGQPDTGVAGQSANFTINKSEQLPN